MLSCELRDIDRLGDRGPVLIAVFGARFAVRGGCVRGGDRGGVLSDRAEKYWLAGVGGMMDGTTIIHPG